MRAYDMNRTVQLKMEKTENTYMIGKLRDFHPVTISKKGTIKFFINSLCDEPDIVQSMQMDNETKEYIGVDEFQRDSVLPDYYDIDSYDSELKEDQMLEHLQNKLIVFHPQFNEYNNGFIFKNVNATDIIDEVNPKDYTYFTAVPVINMDFQQFEDILKNGDFFDISDYDGEINPLPDVIICDDYAYRLNDIDGEFDLINPNENNYTRWRSLYPKEIIKIDMRDYPQFEKYIIYATDNLCFIDDYLKLKIFNEVNYEDIFGVTKSSISIDPPVDDEIDDIVDSRETSFINAFKQYTLTKRLRYKDTDLINFHTSLKTNPLTILAGMSGTGKTQLAYSYAKMLNLSEDNGTLLFMPISPSYTEPNDILGYLNTMSNNYVPAESGFVDFLLHASRNPDKMHMVIFDEMNLSQVEYWFSPFLSIFEKDIGLRTIRLYSSGSECYNKDSYPDTITIGENILFVGTVNIDDTTKDFSDRLLDRTFVIRLDKVTFAEYSEHFSGNNFDTIKEKEIEASKCKGVVEYVKWNLNNKKSYIDAFKDRTRELEFLDELDNLISKTIPNGGISFRVLKNIGNYINNVPINKDKTPIIERDIIFDIAVNQTIMTKIRGTENQLFELLGQYNYEDNQIVDSTLIDLLNTYTDISSFNYIRNTIKNKSEELRSNGFTN